jgi:hypothetical protein
MSIYVYTYIYIYIYVHMYIHTCIHTCILDLGSFVLDLICILSLDLRVFCFCSHFGYQSLVSGIQSTDCLPPSPDCTMALVSQPIAVAAERCNSKLVADPSVTVMDLYQSLDRFLSSRGTNDLVSLLCCMEGLTENDSPTKCGPIFLQLKDLWLELLQWAPNTVLPRTRFNLALTKLNGDRRWNFGYQTVAAAASEVRTKIRLVFSKLRQIALYSEAYNRFCAKVSVPNEFVAQSHRMRINSDQW